MAFRLGQFLVNSGIVNEEDIYDALNIQRKKTVPIGQLASERKWLTVKQIFEILNAQADKILVVVVDVYAVGVFNNECE